MRAGVREAAVFVAGAEFDVVLPDHVASLKERRGVVRPLVHELTRRFAVTAADVSEPVLYRRASIGVCTLASAPAHTDDVLDAVERFVAQRPEIDLLSVRRRLWSTDD